jgi:hypothetical protein
MSPMSAAPLAVVSARLDRLVDQRVRGLIDAATYERERTHLEEAERRAEEREKPAPRRPLKLERAS